MVRNIIRIDEDKCNGCGLCAQACHEGAIAMVDGKARLVREDYCDGLGDCLPACPTGAIVMERRQAPAYDEAAVKAAQAGKAGGGCPGSAVRTMNRPAGDAPAAPAASTGSRLANWPVQIKLAPVNAPYFAGADLLIAADCTAYACGSFHEDFMRGRVALIGCPKLDAGDYAEKLTAILAQNDIRTVTVARMEVPCCGGIEQAVRRALANSGKDIPCRVVILSLDGQVLQG